MTSGDTLLILTPHSFVLPSGSPAAYSSRNGHPCLAYIDADSFASVQSVDNTTVPGTAGFVDVVSIAFTDGAQMDSAAAGEAFRLKLTRDAASDTATGDSEVHRVEIRET